MIGRTELYQVDGNQHTVTPTDTEREKVTMAKSKPFKDPRGGARKNPGPKKGSLPLRQRKEKLLEEIQEHPGLQHYDPLVSLSYMGAFGISREEYNTYKDIIETLGKLRAKDAKALKERVEAHLEKRQIVGEDLKLSANKEVCTYVYAKRRSVEFRDDEGKNPIDNLAKAMRELVSGNVDSGSD